MMECAVLAGMLVCVSPLEVEAQWQTPLDTLAIGKGAGTGFKVGPKLISVTSYGALCNGSNDDTTAIAAAVAAVPYGGALYIPGGSTCLVAGSGAAIFTRTTPITIYGDGPSNSVILVNSTVPNTRDVFHFVPTAAGAGYRLSNFQISGLGGGNYGRHAVHIDTQASGAAAYNFYIDHMLMLPTAGGNSIRVTNTQSSGGVYNSTFSDNNLESVYLSAAGDSIALNNNVISTTSTSNAAIYSSQVAGAGNLQIVGNNISALNGHIVIDSGVTPIIRDNEIETNGANLYGFMIDVLGSGASVWSPQILNNQIQALAGAGNPVPIRINLATNATIAGGRISVISGSHVAITSSATDTTIDSTTQYVTNNVIGAKSISNGGTLTNVHAISSSLNANGVVFGAGAGGAPFTGNISTDNQVLFGVTGGTPVFRSVTGDISFSTGVAALLNIPSATPMAGSLLATAIAAPGTPASGKAAIYVDSTTKRLSSKNDAGTVAVDVVPDTGASNNFLTAISAAGVISKAQPAFTNLSGTISVAQVGGSGASHAVPVDVAGTVTWKVVPDCTDSSGSHLNYTQSTDAWSCGTSTGAAAAGTLTGTTLAANIVTSSLTTVGTLTAGATGAGFTVALTTSTITGTLPCAQEPARTGDVTATAGSCANTLANIPTATPMAGSVLATNITAPGTPASGKTSIYIDSTDKRLHDKNDAGAIGTTVVADAGSSNNFLTAISTAGVISKAQPAFTNLSGTISVAQVGGSGASHAVPVDVAGTITWKVVPDCTDTTGNHLNYTQSTDAWSCGTSAILASGNFANPSASVGLSAVNGSATTAMRSDGAPALDQSIAPTWTGKHIFGEARTIASAAGAVLDDVTVSSTTTTISGNTNITTAAGFNKVSLYGPVLSAASALTITQAATLYIDGPPTAAGAGPASISNPFALYVSTGNFAVGGLYTGLYYNSTTKRMAINTSTGYTHVLEVTPPDASTGDGLFIRAPTTSSTNAGYWGMQIQNAAKTDGYIIGMASSTYATGGFASWIPNSAPFFYFPAKMYFGAGTGATPVMTLDTSGQVTMAYTTASTSKTTGSLLNSGGFGNAGAIFTDTLSVITMANAATTSAVCYNTGTGLLTYDGTLGTCTVSLLAAKDLKAPLSPREGFELVMAMEPWRYTMKKDLPTYVAGEQIGFVADFAAAKDPRVVAFNHDGTLAGFRYEQYTAALTAALKFAYVELKAGNDNLRRRVETLERKVAR